MNTDTQKGTAGSPQEDVGSMEQLMTEYLSTHQRTHELGVHLQSRFLSLLARLMPAIRSIRVETAGSFARRGLTSDDAEQITLTHKDGTRIVLHGPPHPICTLADLALRLQEANPTLPAALNLNSLQHRQQVAIWLGLRPDVTSAAIADLFCYVVVRACIVPLERGCDWALVEAPTTARRRQRTSTHTLH